MTAFGKAIQPFPKAVIIIHSVHPQSFLRKDTKKIRTLEFRECGRYFSGQTGKTHN